MSNYKAIAKRNFIAKWNIYLFDKVINHDTNRISEADFHQYDLNDEVIKRYTTEYWQECKNHKINGIQISEIEKKINEIKKTKENELISLITNYTETVFPRKFTKDDFLELKKCKTCYYCGITTEEIEKLGIQGKLTKKNFRGWNLEVDRVSPNKEYSKENCVMSCYWCNNAKTDEFTGEEFMVIGREIGKALKNRLNK